MEWAGEWNLPAQTNVSSRILWLLQVKDAGVSQIRNFGKKQQVVATEAVTTLPLLAISVEALESDTVANNALIFIAPNGGFGPKVRLRQHE